MVGADCGMGGSDSRRDAPKDDDGLNGLSGAKPVVCGFSGSFVPLAEETEIEGAAVEPVGCIPREEKRDSEKVVFVVPVVLFCAPENELPNAPLASSTDRSFLISSGFLAKEDATLDMTDPPAVLPDWDALFELLRAPVGCDCCD